MLPTVATATSDSVLNTSLPDMVIGPRCSAHGPCTAVTTATRLKTQAAANKRIDALQYVRRARPLDSPLRGTCKVRPASRDGGRLNAATIPSAARTMIVRPGKIRFSLPLRGAVQPHTAMSDAAVKTDVTSAL